MKLALTTTFILLIGALTSEAVEENHQWLLRGRETTPNELSIGHQWSFRLKDGGGRNLHEGYGRLYSDADCSNTDWCGQGPFCIELKNEDVTDGAKLILGDCNGPGWRLDAEGRFHSEVDDYKCMQASHTGRPKEGEKIRIYGCEHDNPLQQFVYEGQQLIKPIGDVDLCVVWQGHTPNIHKDTIILRKCDSVSKRVAWSGDLPIEEECSLSETQSCSLYDTYDPSSSTCPSFFPTLVEFLCPDFYEIPSSGIDSELADEWCNDFVRESDDDCRQRCSN